MAPEEFVAESGHGEDRAFAVVFRRRRTMHAVSVLAARCLGSALRICVHPESVKGFAELDFLEPDLEYDRISAHRDAQGMVRLNRRGARLVYDPPTGNFRLSDARQDLLTGTLHTGKFDQALFSIRLEPQDEVFGFGAASGRYLRENERFRMLNLDTLFFTIPGSSYSSFPFFLLRRGDTCLGVFLASTMPAEVAIYQQSEGDVSPGIYITPLSQEEAIPLDFFVFRGSVADILEQYTRVTGRPFLPPAWAMGYHQSRWSYRTSDRVRHLARRFRAEQIPCDAIHLDIHFMDRYRVFTWHPTRFAEPDRLHKELEALGIRTVAIVDPGVAVDEQYSLYRRGKDADYYLKTSDGQDYVGRVWPGKTTFPDFTRPEVRRWWAEAHDPLFRAGVSGIWNDMNDPVFLMGKRYDPLQLDVHHAHETHAQVRNRYANLEARATFDSFEKNKVSTRPFVLTRSGFSGIQKYAALWTGDNQSSWAHLRENLNMVLSLGLSGVSFCGADIGGFAGSHFLPGALKAIKFHVNRELYMRWMELGSLMPFCRAHTTLYSRDQEPWSFGEEALEVARKHLARRYRLLPYLFTLFWISHLRGAPLVRPLWYEFPSLSGEQGRDQFMLGPHILAAPVLYPRRELREVFLPPGEWFEFETGEKYSAGVHNIPVQPGYYPLFVRAGAILPVCEGGKNAETALASPLAVEIYPAEQMRGELFLDDGVSRSASDGDYFHQTFEGRRDRNGDINVQCQTLRRKFVPGQKELFVRLPSAYRTAQIRNRRQEAATVDLASQDRLLKLSEYTLPLQSWKAVFAYRADWRG